MLNISQVVEIRDLQLTHNTLVREITLTTTCPEVGCWRRTIITSVYFCGLLLDTVTETTEGVIVVAVPLAALFGDESLRAQL